MPMAMNKRMRTWPSFGMVTMKAVEVQHILALLSLIPWMSYSYASSVLGYCEEQRHYCIGIAVVSSVLHL